MPSSADLATARREAGKLSACAWCGAALVQDPDALHRWRCINAEQGKCVARGYWYILTDDLDEAGREVVRAAYDAWGASETGVSIR